MRVCPDGMGNGCGSARWPVRAGRMTIRPYTMTRLVVRHAAHAPARLPRMHKAFSQLQAEVMARRVHHERGVSGRRDCRAALAMTDVPGWLWLPGDRRGSGQAKGCWRVGHEAMLRWACSFVAGLQVVVGLRAIGILTRSQVCISPTAGGVALWFLALILHASGARCLEHGALWQARWPRGLLRL